MLRIKSILIVLIFFVGACGQDTPQNVPTSAVFESGSTKRLQVNRNGTGSGTVTSSPSGINCPGTCTKEFPQGTVVTLTATPAAGSVFAGWSGSGCSGTGTCTTTLWDDRTVTATFNTSTEPPPPPPPPPPGGTFTLTVNKVQNGCGTGNVTSSPAGINCGGTCTASFPAGTVVTLTPSTSSGRFAGWSGGACTGTGNCTITLNANTTVTATYESAPLNITENTLPDGNRGAEYNNFLSGTGGCGGPLRFSIVAGALPNGLSLSDFGVQSALISGTPTTEQVSTFTVRVQDTSGGTFSKTFTITIRAPVTLVVTVPGAVSKSGTVGQFYFQNLFASGGSTPYSWAVTAGQLPPGLRVIRANNGNRIEGTPTTRGTFTFTLTVTDRFGARATQQTSITIN